MGRKVANTLFKNIARGKPTEKVQVAFSGVSISREGWDALERFCAERKPERILEYGPGVSTVLFKRHAKVVHSIESEPQTYNVGLDTLVSKPEGRYDFVFVDGPRGAWSGDKDDIKNYSRYLPVQTARDHTDCIVLHNALRRGTSSMSRTPRWMEGARPSELTEAWWLTLDQMNMYALTNMAGLVIGIPRRHVDQRAW